MGSHYGALIINDNLQDRINDILSLVVREETLADTKSTQEIIGFQPLGREQLAIAFHSDWTIAYGRVLLPGGDEDLFQALASLSTRTKLLYWAVEDTSGSIGFACFVDAEMVRSWFEVEGEVYENMGASLPGEPAGIFTQEPEEDVDEWEIIDVMERESLSWEAINELRFSIYRVPD